MKKLSKYYLSILASLFLCSHFLAAKEPDNEQVIAQIPQGKLSWADIYTSDVNASLNFYTNTFGWTVKKFGNEKSPYHLFYDGKQAIAGVLARSAQRNKTETALWVGSITTDNVQATVDKASNNKATIILQPHNFALYGKRAVIADPQGGVIALLDLSTNNKARQKISNKWGWAQLFSTDTEKSAEFYQNTFNYLAEKVSQSQHSYYLSYQDEIRASIVKLPASFEQRDRWVNFIEVDNLASKLNKATTNGAEIIYQPEDSQLAIITDPNGALLGLIEQESK